MPNKIKPKRSYTANSVPLTTDLETNELAINWADGKAFTKNAAGQIVSITLGGSLGGGGGGGSSSIVTAATVAGFPATGSAANLYIATDTNRIYRWDSANSIYVELGPLASSGDTLLRSYLVPTAPTSVTATAGNAQVSLTWTAASSLSQIPITDYLIQSSTDNGATWTLASDTVSTATSATITGLTNGTAYRFRVAAVNGAGTGEYSSASSAVTPVANVTVEYLVVAGGGSGGVSSYNANATSGGGGAGGYRTNFNGETSGGGAAAESSFSASPGTTYTVTVGAGGSGSATASVNGTSGGLSAFGSISCTGGGYGSSGESGTNGAPGGSGGGGAFRYGNVSGGAGTTGEGYAGGSTSSNINVGGGGGGAGGAGSQQDAGSSPSIGGAGLVSSITGAATTRATGGRGSFTGSDPDGASNTGSGGAGYGTTMSLGRGGNGGSGVVILRCSAPAASTTGSPTVTTVGGDTVYTFTGSGSITF